MITLNQMRHVLAYYNELNQSNAADACCISQVSFRESVMKAESMIGFKLFEITTTPKRSTRPTEGLCQIIAEMKSAVDKSDEFWRKVKSVNIAENKE